MYLISSVPGVDARMQENTNQQTQPVARVSAGSNTQGIPFEELLRQNIEKTGAAASVKTESSNSSIYMSYFLPTFFAADLLPKDSPRNRNSDI